MGDRSRRKHSTVAKGSNRDKEIQQSDVSKESTNDADDELTRLAMEELSQGAKRAKERSQTMGVFGWKNSPIPSANKVYLKNTIIGALQSNDRIDSRASSTDNKSPREGRTLIGADECKSRDKRQKYHETEHLSRKRNRPIDSREHVNRRRDRSVDSREHVNRRRDHPMDSNEHSKYREHKSKCNKNSEFNPTIKLL